MTWYIKYTSIVAVITSLRTAVASAASAVDSAFNTYPPTQSGSCHVHSQVYMACKSKFRGTYTVVGVAAKELLDAQPRDSLKRRYWNCPTYVTLLATI